MQPRNQIPEIIYYDCGEITRISFYINGFLSNQKEFSYKFLIKRDKPYFLKQSSMAGEWGKFVFGLGLFEFNNGSNDFSSALIAVTIQPILRRKGILFRSLKQ